MYNINIFICFLFFSFCSEKDNLNKVFFPKNFNDKILKHEIPKLADSKPIKIITTISGNPPHVYHIMNLFFAYKSLLSKNYEVEKIILMPDSKYYVGGFKTYKRKVFTEEERLELAQALVNILKQNVDHKEFFDKLEVSDFVINHSNSKNVFVDYPDIYKEFVNQNKNFNIVYVGGQTTRLNGNFIAMKRNESVYNMSSTAIMEKNDRFHNQAIKELEYYAPGYYEIIEKKLKKNP